MQDEYEIKIKEELDKFKKELEKNNFKFLKMYKKKKKEEERIEREKEEEKIEEQKRKEKEKKINDFLKKRNDLMERIKKEKVSFSNRSYYSTFYNIYIIGNISIACVNELNAKDSFKYYILLIDEKIQNEKDFFYQNNSLEFEQFLSNLYYLAQKNYNNFYKNSSSSDSNKYNENSYKDLAFKTACDIFAIDYNCTFQEVKDKYKILALKWHPDKNKNSEESKLRMQKINLAYDYFKKYFNNK